MLISRIIVELRPNWFRTKDNVKLRGAGYRSF